MAWRALPHRTEIDQSAARACGAFERVEFVTEAGSPQKYPERAGVSGAPDGSRRAKLRVNSPRTGGTQRARCLWLPGEFIED
jgi:hypothetical protein